MASAANLYPRSEETFPASLFGKPSRDTYRAAVELVEMIACDEGGEQPVRTDLGTLPPGTKEIYVQYRMCGDFYCFIHGDRQVAAVGETRKDAFLAALNRAA